MIMLTPLSVFVSLPLVRGGTLIRQQAVESRQRDTHAAVRSYNPRNVTAPPEAKMANPARAWLYFSSLCTGNRDTPREVAMTTASMVAIVVSPKTEATIATLPISDRAAGYIRRGISGSQGPKTNMMKRTHGVTLFLETCGWPWSLRWL